MPSIADSRILSVAEKLLVILVMTPFLYIAVTVLAHGVPDLPSSGDAALLELSTRNVFSRWILLGPYSRFGFFHPGPIYFQLRYPIYAVLGQSSSSFLLGTVLIQMLCLFFAWKSVRSSGARAVAPLFLASAALYLLTTDKCVWLSEWNPLIVILPFMLLVVAMAGAVSGRLACLAAAVVAGSFATQTHIAVFPSIAAILLLSIAIAAWPRLVGSARRISLRPKPILISLLLLLVLWAAPAYQQLFPGDAEGNMTRIVQYFRESEPQADSRRSFALWQSTMTNLELGWLRDGPAVRSVAIGLRLVLLLAAFVLLRRRGDHPFLASLSLFCLMLHAVSWLSVTQIRGRLEDYLVLWAGVVPLLSLFVILAALVVVLRGWASVCLRGAAALFLLYSCVALPAEVSDYYRAELHPSWTNEIAVAELSRQLRNNLEWDGSTFYVLRLATPSQWPVLFGLLNSLEKMDLPVGVEQSRFYMSAPVPEGMASRTLLLGMLGQTAMPVPELAARWDRIGVLLQ
ncbi:hypothetical protein JW921_08555 [Candidatus Fermentibacterales bacterium]|nr:hypothetical protein [Candidatus Fermentibacterales bacterium]